MSRIISKVSSIDFTFRDLFSSGFDGDEFHKKIVHGPEPIYGGTFQEIFPFFLLSYVHY